jgi:hypothetical protein
LLEILFVTAAVVLAAVGIHYEFLQLATAVVQYQPGPRRLRVAFAIVLAVAAHLVEVTVFAAGWLWCLRRGVAELASFREVTLAAPSFPDIFYFSGSVYTSLGFGDIVPVGPARSLAVAETVTGLVLIAWTASFTYVEMQENWRLVAGRRE